MADLRPWKDAPTDYLRSLAAHYELQAEKASDLERIGRYLRMAEAVREELSRRDA